MPKNVEEIPIEKLRWRCDVSNFSFSTTEDLEPLPTILGQDRAFNAIRMGLELESHGYNIFVTGQAGTGRTTTVRRLLEEREKGEKTPDDKCYVNNFKNPDMPRVLSLPAGQGCKLRKEMDLLVERLRSEIPQVFDSESFRERAEAVTEHYNTRQKEMILDFEKRAKNEGFALVTIQMGPYTKPDVVPLIEDKPIAFEKIEELVAARKIKEEVLTKLREKHEELSKDLVKVFKEANQLQRAMHSRLVEVGHEAIKPVVELNVSTIKEEFESEALNVYLDEVIESVLNNLERFREGAEPAGENGSKEKMAVSRGVGDPFLEYRVNVIVDNSEIQGAPIVFETSPSYKNIFGTIERVMDANSQWRTDFSKIRSGSFLRANGGYLVLNALDALVEPGVWQGLKRTLNNRRAEIQSYDPFFMFTTSALKPEPIEANVKVIMIGDAFQYHLLYRQDDDFKKIFKVKADFDNVMDKDETSILHYASLIKRICDDESLLPMDKTAVGAIIEFGVRSAGRQKKISTRFNHIADLVRESHYWAKKDKADFVTEAYVDKAIKEKIERVSLLEDKITEMIKDGTIMIDTEGAVVGQVNGLSLFDMGDYTFGRPSRITAETAIGRAGIINIEREAEMSGPTHNKGVLILSGYLRGKYAQDKPLAMSASICFEQSYSGVDGDSASSTEIYALLSSLSGLPIRQDIAVTGSVNQKGEIQPIGGVNEKIEGYYEVCKAKGLTGTQGVMIPRLNMDDLMLRKNVVEAVSKGKFHIYPVDTIDQGIELLTGVESGEQRSDGTYPQVTVNALVDKELRELAEKLKEFGPIEQLS